MTSLEKDKIRWKNLATFILMFKAIERLLSIILVVQMYIRSVAKLDLKNRFEQLPQKLYYCCAASTF